MSGAVETTERPAVGELVQVRGQSWVVGEVDAVATSTLVTLQGIDGDFGRTLDVIWEVEPGRRILPSGSLPDVVAGGFDAPVRLAAFLDAVRWSAVTSAEVTTLQAPFRAGVAIEDYQLEPVARAVGAPRVNLLLADDVGLGKTIEAGLVAGELLLRNRARRIMIVCPAGLTTKWRDEMAEKFGLDFTVINSERCAEVRRSFGSAANPFQVFPLTIVSLPWLRGAKAQRLLDEVLPATGPTLPRTFDLLILDEAHHVAPAAPKQLYAVDSQQTKLIRRLAPHFTHRLFLSATPHNGYQASFTALLEILDDQRFARGMEPDQAAVKQTVVRRLKRDVVNADGTPRFRTRETMPIPVAYPDEERAIHALLAEFTALRRKRTRRLRGRKAADLITILLKKRLFSSPAAFAHTVGVYLRTLERRSGPVEASDDVPAWLDDFHDEIADYDDEELYEAEDDAIDRASPLQDETSESADPQAETEAEIALLRRMERWAQAQDAEPDAKARELINYLKAVCRPDGTLWTNERVVVFTEYRDTQRWLAGLLRQEGLDEPHLDQLHGGMDGDKREQLRQAFQAEPTEHPVRILLATDAASEGIDLQNHCHRLVNYDIPFNPNRLEQRIGRIDRYGQQHNPEIRHFVGTGWDKAVDSFEADLEFLSRVALKVARMEADLGPVNAVIAAAVQRRMLGERVDVDAATEKTSAPPVPVETDVRRQVVRLRETLNKTVEDLGITPPAIRRVVATALELARQQPLRAHIDDRHGDTRLFDVPPLTGSWERATAGLTEKLEHPDRPPRQLPITFDPDALTDPSTGGRRDDVVLAHLNHPLVAMSTRLLRAAVSNTDVGLSRVTAVVSDDPGLEDVLVGAFSRFVLVGADGVRLHEEVLYAGGWAPENGRFRRLENLTVLGGHLSRALAGGVPASGPVQDRLIARWPRLRDGLLAAVDWRSDTREQSLERRLAERAEAERKRVVEGFAQFGASLRSALADDNDDTESALLSLQEVTKSREELEQYRRDRRSWSDRLAQLDAERERELAAVDARYADPTPHRFPVAVVFVVPKREAVR